MEIWDLVKQFREQTRSTAINTWDLEREILKI